MSGPFLYTQKVALNERHALGQVLASNKEHPIRTLERLYMHRPQLSELLDKFALENFLLLQCAEAALDGRPWRSEDKGMHLFKERLSSSVLKRMIRTGMLVSRSFGQSYQFVAGGSDHERCT